MLISNEKTVFLIVSIHDVFVGCLACSVVTLTIVCWLFSLLCRHSALEAAAESALAAALLPTAIESTVATLAVPHALRTRRCA